VAKLTYDKELTALLVIDPYIAPIQKAAWLHKAFENGTWGGEIGPEFTPRPGEIVAQEHWCSYPPTT
jgi:hypothetical protein